MNITIVYQYFGTPKGSWSTRIYELSRRWVGEGHELTVITSPYPKSDIKTSKFIEYLEIEGIKVIVINTPDNNKKSIANRIYNSLLFSVFSTYYLLKTPSDIVIASSGPITVGIPALINKIFNRINYVFEVRDLWPRGAQELGLIKKKLLLKIGFWIEKIFYEKSVLVVTASVGQQLDIINRFPFLKTINVSNACDIKMFETVNENYKLPHWALGKSIFLHTGSIGLMNDCIQIIDAAKWIKSNVKNSNILIVFIGDGSERLNLENAVEENNIEFVKFLGLVPKIELVNWVNACSATLLTSANFPVLDTISPNKLFDSFAAGKPIIQTTEGWIKEFITNEECGINVKNSNPKEMGNSILKLSLDDDYVSYLSKNAKRVAFEYFDRNKLAKYYIDEILKVV
ncbi:MAG: glycosyltransferase family 4 protein [Bacteroidetes bacterium]|nr:glycosyltransferase family 4 protein [Bacteroidota bacterium]